MNVKTKELREKEFVRVSKQRSGRGAFARGKARRFERWKSEQRGREGEGRIAPENAGWSASVMVYVTTKGTGSKYCLLARYSNAAFECGWLNGKQEKCLRFE